MINKSKIPMSRRKLLGTGTAALCVKAFPATSQQQNSEESTGSVRNNTSAFRMLDWRDYFDNSRNGLILADINSRAVHFWSEDLSIYRLYPSSVPLTEELTRRGKTEVTQKVENPRWIPTVSMLERNPDWPKVIEGGSPENPLGVRALYLSWPAYRIHGTHDTRKIGRKSSSGCIGLYNEHILELFGLASVGTQVLLL